MKASTDKTPLARAEADEAYYHRPLLPIVTAMAAGIWAGGTWPGHLAWVASAGLFATAAIAWSWRVHRPFPWAPLVFMAVLGYALIAPWVPAAFPETHISHYTDSRSWSIKGTIIEMLPPRQGRTRCVLAVTHLGDNGGPFDVTGRIRVTVVDPPLPLGPGVQLGFTSRIRSWHNFNNPGGFDYRRHMAFKRIHGSAFVHGDRLRIEYSPPSLSASSLDRYRTRARALIEDHADADAQAVLKALLIGDREAVSRELRRIFNRCGVGHLLAISGLHIGIVGGLFFAGLLALMHRLPFVLDRGWGRRAATLAAVGPVLFYACLSGLSPATQRALIMVLAFMATYFIHQEGDTLNFLALAALLMLLVRPPVLFSISFQMSFAAVFWIIMGMSVFWKCQTVSGERPSGWRQRIIAFLLVTCWATAGTLPLTMRYFQEVSLIGLIANCVMVPVVGFFILPVGLASLFVLAIHETTAVMGVAAAGWLLENALHLLRFISAFDGVAMQTFVPTSIEMACFYGILSLLVLRPGARKLRGAVLFLLLVFCADGLYWGYQRFWHSDLRVTVMDVGQGSAALVEFPGGATMLIDGGGHADNRYFDIGARVVAPFLRSRKVMQVDTIVLSHPSSDHMNGLVYVLDHFHPRRLLWTGDRAPTESFRRFYREVIDSGAVVAPWQTIQRRREFAGVAVEVLNPLAGDPTAPPFSADTLNNRSIVLKLTMGGCTILFTGDIEARAEAKLVSCCRAQLTSQVLIAPHHGSRTSSTVGFIDAVDPQVVIFSVGWRNRFGFPHTSVIERFQKRSPRVYRTDHHGAIQLRTDGNRWKVTAALE